MTDVDGMTGMGDAHTVIRDSIVSRKASSDARSFRISWSSDRFMSIVVAFFAMGS